MSEVTSVVSVGGEASDGFEALAGLSEGLFGTGYSASIELSFMVGVLIAVYVAISMFRYFLPEFSLFGIVAGAIGLRDG
jgi:hypothetical protein